MRQVVATLATVTVLTVAPSGYQRPQPRLAVPVEPVTAIVDAFRMHAVVALSEGTHGNDQGRAFLLSLIRDPRFVARVNDIVLEGPNGRFQSVMDRYVRGDDVPIDSLRQVWDETTQVQAGGPIWTGEVPEVYRAVRTLNASLRPDRQLRILLGDPPIDWDQIHTKEDHAKWIAQRDSFPAQLIQREVLARHRRALVVFGNMHFQRRNLLANYETDGYAATVVSLLEKSGTKVFSIWTATDAELADLQSSVATWPGPSLALVRGTVLGAADFTKYYPFAAPRFDLRAGNGALVPREQWRALSMEDQVDAVLYLGPRASITVSPVVPSQEVCADPRFLKRRVEKAMLTSLPPPEIERVKALCDTSNR